MRVYLPSTLRALDAAYEAGELGPPPLAGYAVTPALREWYTNDDDEELEYAAMAQAARASVGLLAADPTAPRRRVVVACEIGAVPPAGGTVEVGDARLDLHAVILWSSVVAVHLDADEAAAVVGAGRTAGTRRKMVPRRLFSPSTRARLRNCCGTRHKRSPTCWPRPPDAPTRPF
jgi:hypothetical protein